MARLPGSVRADVSDEAEKDRTGEAEEDVPKRTVIEDGSVKPNGIATSHGHVGRGSVQLELPMSSNGNGDGDGDADEGRLAERARAIIDSLDKLSSEEVFAAFEELDQLPKDVVRAALEGATGPAPDLEQLDDALRRAHGFPPRALQLRKISVTKDADIFDLGPVAEQQLRLAGKAWDGRDLDPEERLDGEVEDSFAGTLEHHILVDAERPDAGPLFDVLLYAGDAGTIFRAGTTDIVGAIAYGIVEMKDRRSRVAIQEALAQPFEPVPRAFETEEPEPSEEELEVPSEVPSTTTAPTAPASMEEPARARGARPDEIELPAEAPEAPARPKKTAAAKKKETAAASKKAAAAKKPAAATKKAASSKAGAPAKASTKAAPSSKKAAASSKKAAASATKTKTKAPASKPTSKRAAAGETRAAKKATAKKTGGKPAAKKTAAKKSAKKSANE